MNDRDALHNAVLAHPAEDTPRLAFADWLTENGQSEADRARGEFIRLSFERLKLAANSPEWTACDQRCRELHQKYGSTWYAPIPRYVRDYWTSRGFVEGVRISGQQITQWDRHIRWCPTIRHLILRQCRGRLGPVLASPLTAQIETLDIGGVDTSDLEAVATCPHLSNLKLLKLHWATVDDIIALLGSALLPIKRVVLAWYGNEFHVSPVIPDGLALWATSFSMQWQWEHLPRLWTCSHWYKVRDLRLDWRQSQNQRLAEPLGEILEHAPHLTGIRELSLSGNSLDDGQIRALARSPSLNELERLYIGDNRISDDGVEAIVTRWPALTELNLQQNAVGSRGAQAIASGTTRLESLDLESNNIFLPGMVALAHSPRLASLKSLLLNKNPGDSLGASILAASPYLKDGVVQVSTNTPIMSDNVLEELETLPESSAITTLNLKDSEITDRGLQAIARNPFLSSVTELTMNFCSITKVGLDALAEWPGLRTLKRFRFMTSVNNLRCQGKDFDRLFRSSHWGELEYLEISAGHRLLDDGVAALAESCFVPTLRELELDSHEISDVGAEAIAKYGRFDSVRKLALGWNHSLSAKGIAAIVSTKWPSLEEFHVGNLTDEGVKSLCLADLPQLAKLSISGEQLTAEGVHALVSAPWFTRLRQLRLGGKNLLDDAILAFTDPPTRPTGLTHLGLNLPSITAIGLMRLVNSTLIGSVSHLDLVYLSRSAELGRTIAESRGLTAVTHLNLNGAEFNDEVVLALARATHLPCLKELSLGSTECTAACLEELATSPLMKQVEKMSLSFKRGNITQLKRLFKQRLGEKMSIY